MPRFISNGGEWSPAKEQIGLINKSNEVFVYDGKEIQPGEHFIYDGPDREALKMLHEQGEEKLGKNFHHDPDFMQAVRNMGFDNVKQYLKIIGYDEAKQKAEFEAKASVVSRHELPQRVREINIMGGGKDTSGNKADTIGGFGSERVRSPKELKELAKK